MGIERAVLLPGWARRRERHAHHAPRPVGLQLFDPCPARLGGVAGRRDGGPVEADLLPGWRAVRKRRRAGWHAEDEREQTERRPDHRQEEEAVLPAEQAGVDEFLHLVVRQRLARHGDEGGEPERRDRRADRRQESEEHRATSSKTRADSRRSRRSPPSRPFAMHHGYECRGRTPYAIEEITYSLLHLLHTQKCVGSLRGAIEASAGNQARSWRKAKAVAPARLSVPVFAKILRTWTWTVRSLRESVSAIWRFVCPAATRRRISDLARGEPRRI